MCAQLDEEKKLNEQRKAQAKAFFAKQQESHKEELERLRAELGAQEPSAQDSGELQQELERLKAEVESKKQLEAEVQRLESELQAARKKAQDDEGGFAAKEAEAASDKEGLTQQFNN